MRLLTGPVCIVDQTAPKTTPRPTPRDASRINEVRTQLAPAGGRGSRGRPARRGDGVFCFKGLASCLSVCVCVRGVPPRRRPQQQAGHGCSMKRDGEPGFDGQR